MYLELLACLFVFFILHHVVSDLYLFYVKRMPPGPLSLPLIGGMYLISPKQPHLSLEKLYAKYGRIFSLGMGNIGTAVIVMDKDLITEVLDSPHMHDRPSMPIFDLVNRGSNGIGSCCYGKRWMMMTKILHRGLSKITASNLESKTTHAFEQLIQRFLQNNESTNFYPRQTIIQACSAIFSSIVYGINPENLSSPELNTRIQYHYMLMYLLSPSNPMNFLPVLWKLPTPLRRKLNECLQKRDQLFAERFSEHAQQYNGDIQDIMDVIVDFENNNPEKTDKIQRNDLFLSSWTIYLAGCDTTTDISLWVLLYLCVYPEVQEKMREEIDRTIGEETNSILEEKHKLNYTRAAILECLRLSSPTALGLPRTAGRDMTLGGYNIPKGTIIMPNQWHIHHDEALWPEPMLLKPERFLDKEGQLFSNHHIFYQMPYMPFSKGRRPCLGQYVALDIMLLFVTLLLKKAIVQLPQSYVPDLSGTVLFNLQPKDFPIQCIER